MTTPESELATNDWLDACCWRCGAGEPLPAPGGPLLCVSCRSELAEGPQVSAHGLEVGRGAYWEAHPLECCWRCLTAVVEAEDEIGLCGSCRAELTAASELAPGRARGPGPGLGPADPAERSEAQALS